MVFKAVSGDKWHIQSGYNNPNSCQLQPFPHSVDSGGALGEASCHLKGISGAKWFKVHHATVQDEDSVTARWGLRCWKMADDRAEYLCIKWLTSPQPTREDTANPGEMVMLFGWWKAQPTMLKGYENVRKVLCGEQWRWCASEVLSWPGYWPKLSYTCWDQHLSCGFSPGEEPPHSRYPSVTGSPVPCWRAHRSHKAGMWSGALSWFGFLACRAELGSTRDKRWHVLSASPWHFCLNSIAGWTCLDEVQYSEGKTGLLPRPRQCRLNHSHIPSWLDFAQAKPPTAGA